MKRFIACLLAIVILCSSFCYAMPLLKKKETVYVNLENYGNVSEINIYNQCTTNGANEIIDYTEYSELTNLTNRTKVLNQSGEFIWDVSGEKQFSYTGKILEEYYDKLPWSFNVSYKLNGVEVSPEELLGASGLVEINVEVNSNSEANPYYRNNYILEVTASYDMTDYLSVESDEAMITDTGNTKTLMFIVLPGQSTSFNIKLGSNDFSMDGITMAAVPITGDILEEISTLVDEKNDIKDSLDSINISTDIVLNALNGMNIGLEGMSNGVLEIKQGTQELHGISDLRDEDVAKLKSILEELLPITQNVQKDLENLEKNYEIFIEMYENLDSEVKNLQSNVAELNESFDDIVSMSKNLPNDVKDIKELIDSIAKLTGDLSSLLNSLDDENTSNAVKKNLESLGEEAENLVDIAQETEDVETAMQLVSSAKSIAATTKNIQTIFEQISLSEIKGKTALAKDLTKLKENLYDVDDILDKDDAKKIRDFISDLKDTTDTLEKMLTILSEYNDKTLENKEDVTALINNMQQLVNELSEMNTLSISMINTIQTMLQILSSSIYQGTDTTLDAINSLSKQMLVMTSQTSQFKNSKDEIKNIVENKWDKVEDETTLFNVDKDAKPISFGNEKNENIDSVQFIFKTPDIKKLREAEKDLEAETEKLTFWDRVILVLKKLFSWLKK